MEEGAEEDEDQRLVKIMAELTLVSARMVALVKAIKIVMKIAENEAVILSFLVPALMVSHGPNVKSLQSVEDHVVEGTNLLAVPVKMERRMKRI